MAQFLGAPGAPQPSAQSFGPQYATPTNLNVPAYNTPTAPAQNAGSFQGTNNQNNQQLAQQYEKWATSLQSTHTYDQVVNALWEHLQQNQSPQFANNFINWYKTQHPRPTQPLQQFMQPQQPQMQPFNPFQQTASSKTGKFTKRG